MMRHAVAIIFSLSLLLLSPVNSWAITTGQIDDFQTAATQDWDGSILGYVADAGPNGVGDTALFSGPNTGKRSAVIHNDAIGTGIRWTGNYVAAGVTRIELDLRNPNPTGGPLTFWLGMAGVPSAGSFGTGDTYVTTNSVTIPGDNLWHSVGFDIEASDWTNFNGTNAGLALSQVSQIRLIQNPIQDFLGGPNNFDFYVDNIRAVPEPATLLLTGLLGMGSLLVRKRT